MMAASPAAANDASSLRAAIEFAVSDASRAQAMAEAGRKSAEEHFSIERYVSALAGILRDGEVVGAPEAAPVAQTG